VLGSFSREAIAVAPGERAAARRHRCGGMGLHGYRSDGRLRQMRSGAWLPQNEFSTDQGELYNRLTPLRGTVTQASVERD
jgi:hypothetical protein